MLCEISKVLCTDQAFNQHRSLDNRTLKIFQVLYWVYETKAMSSVYTRLGLSVPGSNWIHMRGHATLEFRDGWGNESNVAGRPLFISSLLLDSSCFLCLILQFHGLSKAPSSQRTLPICCLFFVCGWATFCCQEVLLARDLSPMKLVHWKLSYATVNSVTWIITAQC